MKTMYPAWLESPQGIKAGDSTKKYNIFITKKLFSKFGYYPIPSLKLFSCMNFNEKWRISLNNKSLLVYM